MNAPQILADGSRPFVKMAEEWLVGGMMLAGSVDDVRACDVDPHDFRDTVLGVVWKAILDVCARGEEPDVPNVAQRLMEMRWLDRVGAESFLVELTSPYILINYSRPTALVAHAAIVKKWARSREVIQQAGEMAKSAYEGNVTDIRTWRSGYAGTL